MAFEQRGYQWSSRRRRIGSSADCEGHRDTAEVSHVADSVGTAVTHGWFYRFKQLWSTNECCSADVSVPGRLQYRCCVDPVTRRVAVEAHYGEVVLSFDKSRTVAQCCVIEAVQSTREAWTETWIKTISTVKTLCIIDEDDRYGSFGRI